jgi:hypothetical protein
MPIKTANQPSIPSPNVLTVVPTVKPTEINSGAVPSQFWDAKSFKIRHKHNISS